MKRKVDLHIHTCASDGEWTPKELLDKLKEKDIKIFAINDHDTVDSLEEMATLVENEPDMICIPSLELSVTYKGREIHILCYYVDYNNDKIAELIDYNAKAREDYNRNQLKALMRKYKGISFEGYESYRYNPKKGGWKMLQYLIDAGITKDLYDFFGVMGEFEVEKVTFMSPEEVFPILREAGVIPILAHPSNYTEGDLYEIEELDYWRSVGIAGIECYSIYLMDIKNSSYYVDYCNKYNLQITGGSDCHGSFAGRELGVPEVTEDMIKLHNK